MIEEKIQIYFENKEAVVAVYVFGSYAQGKERPSSDLDIGILLDRDDQNVTQIRNTFMAELARILRKDIHPVILNSANEALLKQIFSKGKCIVVNDPKKLAKYKMVRFAQIAEFAHYRSQMQGGLIKKVMERRIVG